MKERGIILKDWEVRGILDGRITQLRRVIKPQPEAEHGGEPYWHIGGYRAWKHRNVENILCKGGKPLPFPYGQPGDRLWVKEDFGTKVKIIGGGAGEFTTYKATDPNAVYCETANGSILPIKWKPGAHMPRWFSRITLEVTGVRVERVQDISGPDCWAAGIESAGWDSERYGSVTECYRDIWNSIYGKPNIERDADGKEIARHDFSWDANPLVRVIDVETIKEV